MLIVLILAENRAFAKSLKMRLELCYNLPEARVHLLTVGKPPEGNRYVNQFQELHDEISRHIDSDWAEGTAPLCVVTDLQGYGPLNLARLNPMGTHGWSPVLGMLILALPEVHWVLAGCSSPPDDGTDRTSYLLDRSADFSNILRLSLDAEFCPLFDATGIRDLVRQVCVARDVTHLPSRAVELAAAIDDEREYALFYAYVAYRFGFRCHVVTTSTMMHDLLFGEGTSPITLAFEDLFLNFSDQHIPGMSNLRERDQTYNKLSRIPRRVIVTTGYQHRSAGAESDENHIYLSSLRAEGKWNVVVRKPVTGVYSLWKGSGVSRRVGSNEHPGYASGFQRFVDPRGHGSESTTGHSTPGRLMEISKRLLNRAARDPANPRSSCSAVHRAVLATDALELLGGRTPTTSLGALAQCHEVEALAEVQFVGVEGNFDLGWRLADLRREIEMLAAWYNPADRQFSAWNAERAILQRLIQVFQGRSLFSEEQFVRIRERELHRRIWFRSHFGEFGGGLRWLNPAYLLACYVDILLRSMSVFLVAIALWIIMLTVLYALQFTPIDWSTGFHHAVVNFFSMQPPDDKVRGGFVLFAILAGVLHVGVLIAHLYAVASRR